MADFTGRRDNLPVLGAVAPQTCLDLGVVITGTAQGAGTQNSGRLYNTSSRGVRVTLDITAVGGTIDVVVNIYTVDPASGVRTLRLASASKTATGTTELLVTPDIAASANLIAQNFLGAQFEVDVVNGAGSTPAATYTVGVCLLP